MQKEQGLEEIRNVLILNTSSLSDVGLYGGKMGVSIFLAHYARYSNQDVYLDLVHSLIKEIKRNWLGSELFVVSPFFIR